MTYTKQWFQGFAQCQKDALAALLVGFAIIPESIAFSLIAGVSPQVGIYASVCILLLGAVFGGRPALISAATGAMALVLAGIVKHHGIEYMFAASVLAGVIQIALGALGIARLMSFVPRPVMVGFVNALAILIFAAQVPELMLSSPVALGLCIASLVIIYGFGYIPKIGKALPSGLVALVLISLLAHFAGLDVRVIKDLGELPTTLPTLHIPSIPLELETLKIILPYSLSLALVGILESLMTSALIDQITNTPSSKRQECIGQGICNIGAGMFGGMAGCGMIGQSMINIKSGARTRLSTLLAGVYLCVIVVFLGEWASHIPMAALVAIMIMVSIGTFDWSSLKGLYALPLSSNAVMLATVATTILTSNLALGVVVGVTIKALLFVNKASKFVWCKTSYSHGGRIKTYKIQGQVFFKSTEKLMQAFEYDEDIDGVVIDLSGAWLWDISAASELDKAVQRFAQNGVRASIIGQNLSSQYISKRFHRL